ncbi:alpha/beta hydrolase-fold protein [uncultured Psychroserpens sp.]|uniref:alpha/beta hydrolase n=1 Tax=uncultured Psychroserpens sp. TaxID=255436 RepID=UPI00260B7A83|nr:alpha/beta hydrolase-fold protein [uncultured Psychroserpens sp.]
MKRLIFTFTLISLLNINAQSKVLESLSMTSKLLNTEINYSVYLPNGFDDSKNTYPIVYLLNGFTGDETDWVKHGELQTVADQLIENGKVLPMVIVMPDGDDRLYMNKDDNTYPYEDMLITEFLPFIENKYRVKDHKKYRGIAGLSMGGAGSLRLALKYHELFGVCAGFSAGISTEEEIMSESSDSFDSYFGRLSPSIIGSKGKDRITETYKDYDVLHLVNTKAAKLLKTVKIYFDCGDDDFLTVGNAQLHIDLTKKEIPHEYRVRDGKHTWEFWKDSLHNGLIFISNTMLNN